MAACDTCMRESGDVEKEVHLRLKDGKTVCFE